MSELLSCPFCGGEAEMLTAESMHGGYLFGIMCNDCRSRGDVYGTEAEAIAAWNSRAERTCRDTGENDWHFVCSACSYEQNGYEQWNYCPNCGARVISKTENVMQSSEGVER